MEKRLASGPRLPCLPGTGIAGQSHLAWNKQVSLSSNFSIFYFSISKATQRWGKTERKVKKTPIARGLTALPKTHPFHFLVLTAAGEGWITLTLSKLKLAWPSSMSKVTEQYVKGHRGRKWAS